MQQVTVLYVAGTGRSGSTLVANMLGQLPGLFSAGELNNLFKRGIVEDWYCGCGVRFSHCEVWRSVLSEAFGSDGVDIPAMVTTGDKLTRVRHVPQLLSASGRADRLGADAYLESLDRLYRALADLTESRVIVDSSKSPSYGYLLGFLPSVNLRVLHLVRDPRGTAFSWQRKRLRSDGAESRYMQTMSGPKACALWSIWNLTAELMWSRSGSAYTRVRYEDLVAEPAAVLRKVLTLVDLEEADLSFVSGSSVSLLPSHTVSGNPMRLATGEVELKPDVEWISSMPRAQRLLITALTAHSLRRYGYSLTGAEQFSLRTLS